jgi:hypothetical protein
LLTERAEPAYLDSDQIVLRVMLRVSAEIDRLFFFEMPSRGAGGKLHGSTPGALPSKPRPNSSPGERLRPVSGDLIGLTGRRSILGGIFQPTNFRCAVKRGGAALQRASGHRYGGTRDRRFQREFMKTRRPHVRQVCNAERASGHYAGIRAT